VLVIRELDRIASRGKKKSTHTLVVDLRGILKQEAWGSVVVKALRC
jgi:hypothetical protein